MSKFCVRNQGSRTIPCTGGSPKPRRDTTSPVQIRRKLTVTNKVKIRVTATVKNAGRPFSHTPYGLSVAKWMHARTQGSTGDCCVKRVPEWTDRCRVMAMSPKCDGRTDGRSYGMTGVYESRQRWGGRIISRGTKSKDHQKTKLHSSMTCQPAVTS